MTSRLHCACDTHRRGFLGGLAALGAGALLPGCAAPAAALPPRIDTHHHFFSPTYVAELDKVGQAPPIVKNWSLEKTLDDMSQAGVATSILSVTTPQVGFADPVNARRIARESNEYAARLGADHRGRFGSFAMLPMQDSESALRELEYALDTLKAVDSALAACGHVGDSLGQHRYHHMQLDALGLEELCRAGVVFLKRP